MANEKHKPDLVLKNGKEIFVNFDAVTYKEILGVFDPEEPKEKSDTTIGKICGFETLEEFYACTANDVRRCGRAAVQAWVNWQVDPND